MNEQTNTDRLLDILRVCLEKFDSESEVKPALLASEALKVIDPDDSSPVLMSWAANLELRQLSRGMLRNHYDPTEMETPQIELFEGLQDRYPTKRGGEPTYVLLAECTDEEIQENLDRMARQITGLQKHHDALEAYLLGRQL